MDDALRPESLRPLLRIRDVISMREEDVAHAAQPFDRARERLAVARRIDHPIATVVAHQIAVAAVRLVRIEAAIISAVFDLEREVADDLRGAAAMHRADGRCRTRDQRTQRGALSLL